MSNLYPIDIIENTTGELFGKTLTVTTNLSDKLKEISKMDPGSLMDIPVGQITNGLGKISNQLGNLPINNFANQLGKLPDAIGKLPIDKLGSLASKIPSNIPTAIGQFSAGSNLLKNLPLNQISAATNQLSGIITKLPINNIASSIAKLPISKAQEIVAKLPIEDLQRLGAVGSTIQTLTQGDVTDILKQVGLQKVQGIINQLPINQLNSILSNVPAAILGNIPTNNITGALAQLSATTGLNFGSLASSMNALGLPGVPGNTIGMQDPCAQGAGGYGIPSAEGSAMTETARHNVPLKSGGPPGSGNVVNNGRGTPYPMLANLLMDAAKAIQVDVTIFSLDRARAGNKGNHLDGMGADIIIKDGAGNEIKSNHQMMKNFVDYLFAKERKLRIGAGPTYMGKRMHVDVTAVTKGRPAVSWGDGCSWRGRIDWLVELDRKYKRRS